MNQQVFLEKIEPFIASDDFLIRNFCLDIVEKSFIGTEETFMLGLEANDKNWKEWKTNVNLLKLKNLPMPAQGMEKLLARMNDESLPADQQHFFVQLISHADPCLVNKYYEQIESVYSKWNIPAEGLLFYAELCEDSGETVFYKLNEVLKRLNRSKYLDQPAFTMARQIVKVIAKRKLIAPADVLKSLVEAAGKKFLGFDDLLQITLAGELRLESSTRALKDLLVKNKEDDIFLEEWSEAMVKIGTDEAVDAVRPFLDDKMLRYHTSDVPGSIKTEHAKEALMEEFDRVKSDEAKTMLAAALCEQLSVEVIPKVEKLIKNSYSKWILSLEEFLYCNCVINGVEHPQLEDWKRMLVAEEKKIREEKLPEFEKLLKGMGEVGPSNSVNSPRNQEKIGRNDPCPCGSGKKYKKCCL